MVTRNHNHPSNDKQGCDLFMYRPLSILSIANPICCYRLALLSFKFGFNITSLLGMERK
jgi:hypothetical protein